MAFIREFTIYNLAGRGTVTHRRLDRHVNVFWGLNGTGKTTLLKILDAALANKVDGLARLPFDAAEVIFHSDDWDVDIRRTYIQPEEVSTADSAEDEPWFEFDEERLEVIRDEVEYSDSPEWSSTLLTRFDVPARVHELNFQHTYLPISRVVESREDPSTYRHPNSRRPGPEERFVTDVQRVWSRYFSKSNAQIREVQQRGLAVVLSILFGGGKSDYVAHPINVTDTEAYDLVTSFLGDQGIELQIGKRAFSAKYKNSAEHRMVVAEIEVVRRRVGEILTPQFELQAVVDAMYRGNKHLELSGLPGHFGGLAVVVADKAIPLAALSSGEKQLLQLLLEVLAIGPSTIMIDEPEISLHVDWQQRLVESMRRINPQSQLLLATHSPEVMVDIDEQFIFEL